MKPLYGSIVYVLLSAWVYAQQPEEALPAIQENMLEETAAATDMVPEDDTQWQRLSTYARRKLSLNTADEADLQSLGLLHPLQISSFLTYRQVMGKLVSIYELQVIPGFDPELIQRILPYVAVGNDLAPHYSLRDYMRNGEHSLLLRYGRQLERAKGYMKKEGAVPHYLGSPDKLLLRYRYSFPRYASWGITMKKDAGEQFFSGAQQAGFDFYSAHLFIRNYRKIKALALGDFTVNMGQGLVNWQAHAMGKSSAVMNMKREGEVLRPYSATGEFNFFRGIGITLQQKAWQVTGFLSLRQLDGNFLPPDSVWEHGHLSSIIMGGYHRAANELAHQNTLQQFSGGGNLQYNGHRWKVGANVIYHHLSLPLQKKEAPYNQFEFSGQQAGSASIDYAGYWKNVHFFGEAAMSYNGHIATVNGALTSVLPWVDIAVLYRNYHPGYQSMYSNAFGDGYKAANERGVYVAASVSLSSQLKINAYADIFRFPWVKYKISTPSNGQQHLLLLTYSPSKYFSASIRYRAESGSTNIPVADTARLMQQVMPVAKRNVRCQLHIVSGQQITLQSRLEMNHYRTLYGKQTGWLLYQQIQYRLKRIPVNITCRITAFSATGYDSRIYTIESSVLYDYALSQLYGKGMQFNTTVKWRIRKGLSCWGRMQRVFYADVASIGSGWDQVNGHKKSVIQLQVQQLF